MIPKNSFKKLKEFQGNYFKRNNLYVNYGRKTCREVEIILILLLTTALITSGFFYIFKLLWHAYVSTPVGKEYISIFTENSQAIFAILSGNCIGFSISLTLRAFYVCLAICTACRLFYIARFFYDPREFLGRLCFWGLPMAVMVAIYLRPIYKFTEWEMALFLSVVPTLVMFTGCFRATSLLLPEVGDIIAYLITYLIKKGGVIKECLIRQILPRLKQKAQHIIDRINAS
ncbi:MAG: hypothetical protein JJV92_10205 [Desulfosarcina sp.]|nr:hypothetical protein [Desulfobacterales bacterium]